MSSWQYKNYDQKQEYINKIFTCSEYSEFRLLEDFTIKGYDVEYLSIVNDNDENFEESSNGLQRDI